MENRASVVVPKTVHVVPLALSALSLVVGVASIIVAGIALSSTSWSAVDENPLGLSNMIAGPTGFMAWVTAWEYGPESKWRSICSDDITFSIPALGANYSGKDSLWGFRKYLSGGTFGQLPWTNTYGSYLQDETDPSILYATMTSFYRAPPVNTSGATMQIGRWTAHFNDDGEIDSMHQDVIYAEYNPTFNACSDPDPPATICVV